MAKVRERYWIPRLRTILKNRESVKSARLWLPQRGLLPEKRVTAKYPFAVTGVDLFVPFTLKKKKKKLKAMFLSSLVEHPGQFILQLPKLWKQKSLFTN